VLEFTAEEGRVYIPYWMMQNLGLSPNDFVIVTSTELPRASFVKLRPKTVDFLDISDPRAVYVYSWINSSESRTVLFFFFWDQNFF
jgi:ubiquitin fusion degradation protein 1